MLLRPDRAHTALPIPMSPLIEGSILKQFAERIQVPLKLFRGAAPTDGSGAHDTGT
jgi:hypothetical protein